MPEIWGLPQSDRWLRARCGRLTGSQFAKMCSYLTRVSGNKKAGDSTSTRDKYRRAVIGERLTGKLANHWESDYMKRGNEEEEPARRFYEMITKSTVLPVSFIIHPDMPFTGATADGLIGKEGVLEIKNPETANHIAYWRQGLVPEKYMPQVAWEIACRGKVCRFADFLSFDRRIQDPKLCYFLKRTGRDELEWEVGSGNSARKLTGEAVIDYFTNEVVRADAEINHFIETHATTKALAPFVVDVLDDSEELEELAEGEIPMTEAEDRRCGRMPWSSDRQSGDDALRNDTVWIIERNHHPYIEDGQPVAFPDTPDGTQDVREYLNTFPRSSADSENYYDAVLYVSRQKQ